MSWHIPEWSRSPGQTDCGTGRHLPWGLLPWWHRGGWTEPRECERQSPAGCGGKDALWETHRVTGGSFPPTETKRGKRDDGKKEICNAFLSHWIIAVLMIMIKWVSLIIFRLKKPLKTWFLIISLSAHHEIWKTTSFFFRLTLKLYWSPSTGLCGSGLIRKWLEQIKQNNLIGAKK